MDELLGGVGIFPPHPGYGRDFDMSEPHVELSMEQRAVLKRYLQFGAVFAVIGVAFSIFLISSGNNGGWGLLGILAFLFAAGYFFIQRGRAKNGRV
ncbi:hypothetical protein OG233_11295 [Streptomyces sp. NBC_01218]|uniref:hypothetical protein n=1 Tax=Streptomyces sp. NBC_01218 TaxID=2903780 RepID=UPI002E119B52|nr:hypothetical protein OG233_11295 [Streptomyces sp. NBC_01218]